MSFKPKAPGADPLMERSRARENNKRIALSAILLALMLVLGFVESLVSLSAVPGIKVGLSNCLLLLTLYGLGIRRSFELMVLKVLLSGILFGNPISIQYGLAGGLLSVSVMSLLIRGVKGLSPVGVGIAGGVTHNMGQVLLAMLVLGTPGLLSYMAILMAVGGAMGALTGSLSLIIRRALPEFDPQSAKPGPHP